MLFYKEYDGSPVGQLILVCDEAALHMLILSDAPDKSGRSSPSVPDRAVRKETPVIKKPSDGSTCILRENVRTR